MKKVLYRDELFWFEVNRHPEYDWTRSTLRLFRKREGWLSIFLPYVCIGERMGDWTKIKTKQELSSLLKEVAEKEANKPVLIECSAEVNELYKD